MNAQERLDVVREWYSEEIRLAAALRSEAVVRAFGRVPRERFLGPGPWQLAVVGSSVALKLGLGTTDYVPTPDSNPERLYHNVPVAIDPARLLNNGQPSAVAALIDALDLQPGQRAAHVGCGTGYFSAVMADVVGAQGQLLAIDVDASLASRAADNLRPWPQARAEAGDGSRLPSPLDAILINAGATHPRPEWLDALADGGRLVVPITVRFPIPGRPAGFGSGFALRLERISAQRFHCRPVVPIAIYDCEGARDPALEDKLKDVLRNPFGLAAVKALRRDPHERTSSCVLHADTWCLSIEP
ncbi:MAG TPA: methyltransferase domain-containing protein [Myxococcaceae bacterium]|nr:methyltransferase domain-containing protein [Myxococcaceae bacterium]